MDSDEGEFEISPFTGPVHHDGVQVELRIYRFASSDEQWQLEVVAPDGTMTSWEELFDQDEDAFEAFLEAMKEDGIRSFLEPAVTHH